MDTTKPMLAKRHKYQAVSAVMLAVALTGCASGPAPRTITIQELDRYQMNCADKQAQLQFLETQYNLSLNNQFRTVAKYKMDYYRSYCP